MVLATCLLLLLATGTQAQNTSDRSALEQSLRYYFEHYGPGRSGFLVKATLNSVQVDDEHHNIRITANDGFSEQ